MEELNGLEAWRAICRVIDQGRPLRLECLRRQLRVPEVIKDLAAIPLGITKFEKLVKDFVAAGGERPTDAHMKSDLLEMFPEALRDQLFWHATEPSWNFSMFRARVVTTAARILHYKGRLPVHTVNEEQVNKKEGNAGDLIGRIEEVLLAARRMGFAGKRGAPQQTRAAGGQGGEQGVALPRPPRCVNCGSIEHLGAKCPKPRVAMDARPCYE